MSELAGDQPNSHLVYQFPGSMCGVPSVVGRFWIQPVQILHAIVVLDLTAAGGPKEVSRVVLERPILPHWTGLDPRTHRLAVSGYDTSRFYLLTFDPDQGKVALDRAFHDRAGRPGIRYRTTSMAARLEWGRPGARYRLFEVRLPPHHLSRLGATIVP